MSHGSVSPPLIATLSLMSLLLSASHRQLFTIELETLERRQRCSVSPQPLTFKHNPLLPHSYLIKPSWAPRNIKRTALPGAVPALHQMTLPSLLSLSAWTACPIQHGRAHSRSSIRGPPRNPVHPPQMLVSLKRSVNGFT